MTCSHCGAQSPDHAVTCVRCGNELSAPTPPAPYQPSGKVKPTALLVFLVGCAGSALAGAIYQAIIRGVGHAMFSFLLLLCFAVAAGLWTALVVHWGHCRNIGVAILIAIGLAVVALGTSFCWDYVMALNGRAEAGTSDPTMSFFDWLQARVQAGFRLTFGHGGSTGTPITGAAVPLIWGLEAAAVISMAVSLGKRSARAPYCERCSSWLPPEKKGVKLTFWGLTASDAREFIKTGNLDRLLALTAQSKYPSPQRLVLNAVCCARCRETSYMSVAEVVERHDEQGKNIEQRTPLVSDLALSRAQFEALLNRPWESRR